MKRSSENYRDLVENINDVLYSIDADGSITYVSPQVESVFGYTPAELAGQLFLEFIHPDDLGALNKAFAEVLQGRLYPSEYRLRAKNGEYRWVRTSSRPIRKGERTGGLNGVLTDITERKQVEEELQKNLVSLSQAETIAKLGYFERNWQTGEGYWSHGFFKLLGFEPGEITCTHEEFTEYIHPEDRERVAAHIEESIKTRQKMDVVFRLVTKDQKALHIHGIAETTYQGKTPLLTRGTFQDITDRVLTEEKLMESEAKFQDVVSSIPGAVYQYVRRPNGEISIPFMSEGAVPILNRPLEELQDPSLLFENVHPDDIRDMWASIEDSAQTMNPWRMEFRIITESGDTKWLLGASNPRAFPDGSICWNGVLLDITERKRVEEALRLSEDKFSKAFQCAPLLMTINSIENGRCIELNDAFARVTGFGRETALGATAFELGLLSREERNRMMETLDAEGRVRDLELELTRSDGSKITCLYSNEYIEVEGKTRLLAVAIDITERKKAEEALQLYGIIVSSASEPMAVIDENYTFLMVNKSYEDFWNIDREKIIGKRVPDIMGKEKFEKTVKEQVDRCLAGEPVKYSAWFQSPTLGPRYMNLNYYPYRAENGSIAGLINISYDLTEQKKTEESLRESEERFETAMKFANDGLFDWNLITNQIYYSPGWKRLLGYEDHEIKNEFSEWERLTKPEDVKASWAMLNELLEGKRDRFEKEFRMLHKDGRWVDILSRANVGRDEQGRAVRVVGTHVDITERKRAEEALRESEERFRLAFHTSPDSINLNRLSDGMYIDSNDGFTQIMGYSRDDVIGKTSLSLNIWKNPEDRKKLVAGLLESGCVDNLDAEFMAKDGSLRNGLMSARVLQIMGEDIIISITRDITDRKKMEDERRLNETRLEALLKLNEKYLSDPNELAEYALEQSARLTRSRIGFINFLSEDEKYVTHAVYTQETREQCEIPENAPAFAISDCGLWSEAYRQRSPVVVNEYHAEHPVKIGFPSGHPPLERFMSIPIIEENRVVAVAALGNKEEEYEASDVRQFRLFMEGLWRILQHKQSEQALRASEEKFSKAFQNAPLLMTISTVEDGRYLDVNEAFVRVTGYTRDVAIGKSSVDLGFIKNEDRNRLSVLLQNEGRIPWLELELTDAGGSKIICLYSGQIIEVEGKKRLLSIASDITERKKLQSQLQQAQKMEAIGTLAGGIAHDFNNILWGMIGFTEMSLFDVPKGSELEENLNHILSAGHRAKDLVQQILSFSRMSEQKRRPLELHLIIGETLKLLRASIPATIEIKQNIAKKGATILADPTQIHQIIMNLCTNAAHAMEADGGVLEVSLEPFNSHTPRDLTNGKLKEGPYVQLSVTDTGAGMDPQTLDRIFDPYYTTKAKETGTGLGLAVVHGIVTAHGGAVNVHSEPGKGSVFDVYFPRINKNLLNAEKKPVPLLPRGDERILFVDDEEGLISLATRMLGFLGYDVVTKTNSMEALELFRKRPDRFDLVITDLTMPFMTGEKLAQALMKVRPDIPVILCSGYSEKLSQKKAKEIGIRTFLTKPIVLKDMSEIVRKVLDEAKNRNRT